MFLLSFVSTIGALQGGIILASILFKFRHQKNTPLALLLIVFSVRLVTIPTWNPEVLISRPWLIPLTTPLPFLFGPFLWWYIKELSSDSRDVPKYPMLHILPYFLEVLAISVTLLNMRNGEYELFIRNVFSGNPPLWLPIRNGLKVLLNAIYVGLSARLAFSKKANRLSRVKRLWLRFLVVIPAIVLAAFSYVAIVPKATEYLVKGSATPFFILATTMAVLIYSVSFLLLIAPNAYKEERAIGAKWNPGLCSEIECEHLLSLVEKCLNEGAFRNPDLLLTDLAAEFNVHSNRLSFAINQHRNTSFRALLNKKRLDYFILQINRGELQKQSILGLAFKAGFPSKSKFNRVFKEHMGMSPSTYLKSIQK